MKYSLPGALVIKIISLHSESTANADGEREAQSILIIRKIDMFLLIMAGKRTKLTVERLID